MTQKEAQDLKNSIDAGYHNREQREKDGYPPYPSYALVSWEDRGRFREYVFGIIDKFVKE